MKESRKTIIVKWGGLKVFFCHFLFLSFPRNVCTESSIWKNSEISYCPAPHCLAGKKTHTSSWLYHGQDRADASHGIAATNFRYETENRIANLPSNSCSFLAEPDSFLDGPHKLLRQRIKALVWRQVQSVETSVRLGQLVLLSRLFNRESSRPIWTLEILETVDRNSRGASSELQKPRLLLCVPSPDDL